MFWVNVPVGIVAALVTRWAVRESKDPSTRHLDLPGTALVTAGLLGVVWALIKAGEHGWGSTHTLGYLGGGLALLGAFVAWERHTKEPMLPLSFFRVRAFSVASVLVALVGFGMFGVIFFISLYFQNTLGYSPLEAGVRTLPMTLTLMAIAPLAGKINARIGPRYQLTAGMFFSAVGLLGLSRAGVHSSYNEIWPFYALMGAGLSLAMPAVSATGMGAVDPRKTGVASGVINASRQVGGALGIAVLGSVGAALTGSRWSDSLATLPAATQGQLAGARDLVLGGQAEAVGRIAGPAAQEAAADAFMQGVSGALLCGGALMAAAAVVAFFGLKGFRPPAHHEQPVAAAVEA